MSYHGRRYQGGLTTASPRTSNDINSVLISPYSAANIEASNWTLSTGKASYQGSQSILLKPGFKVEKNAVFKAEINKVCSYTSDINDPT